MTKFQGFRSVAFATIGTAGMLLMADSLSRADEPAGTLWAYVGTYTSQKPAGEGIYRLEFDPKTGTLSNKTLAAKVADPSFLAIAPGGKFLYAVNETATFQGQKGGEVSAFAIDPATGDLTLLNQQPSLGAHPCHISVDAKGKNVLVANYSGGNVACLPIAPDGSLKPASAVIQHEGKGSNASRQEKPHAHSINLDFANRFAFAADLGLDRIFIYEFDPEHGKLAAHEPPALQLAPGLGPRHLSWHPSGVIGYAITELGNTIEVLKYEPETGTLADVQSVSTLPPDFQGKSGCSEVLVHPTGNFVYGANRGHDSIAVFQVENASGKLTSSGFTPTGGKNPRNFVIAPNGKFLLAENQDSGTIVVFAIDPKTGALKPAGEPVAVPKPVCIRFLPKTPAASGR